MLILSVPSEGTDNISRVVVGDEVHLPQLSSSPKSQGTANDDMFSLVKLSLEKLLPFVAILFKLTLVYIISYELHIFPTSD